MRDGRVLAKRAMEIHLLHQNLDLDELRAYFDELALIVSELAAIVCAHAEEQIATTVALEARNRAARKPPGRLQPHAVYGMSGLTVEKLWWDLFIAVWQVIAWAESWVESEAKLQCLQRHGPACDLAGHWFAPWTRPAQ